MPKMKTHSGAKDRFRVTKKGKVIAERQNVGHLNEHKSSRRKRRLSVRHELTGGDAKQIKRMLGLR